SLYIGNRPYHISKGNIMGVVPGAIFGAGVAIFLSIQLANGNIDLLAPQANAFATFSVIFAEGQGDLLLLGLGLLLGMFVEWATGMGTSFGLGMYLDIPHTLPMLIGGGARDWWEEKKLKPRIDKVREEEGQTAAEKTRALALLGTFMVAAGLLTGEAFFGTESSILSFIDSVLDPQVANSRMWWALRMGMLIGLNVVIGGAIFLLFRAAGVIGGDDEAEASAA
ncbi:MAG: OPT/YSL family transporter, partial [Candidatus Thermoplasmatota archaeon]|nr:OPT/YSL family transporter [Candidatus Thermoplasmatota archaeon]